MTAYASAHDETIFCVDELVEALGNDERAVRKVVHIVRDCISTGIEPLNQAGDAVQQARFMEARRIVHRLRDTVSELGAKRFVAACMGLELALAEGKVLQIPLLFTAVENELRLVMEHAGAWLDQHAGRASAR
ncbi:Hpt domain-containing protein [Pseudoduganella chitinolytica]|uniref:Hpt domain-containing protein n=1 Tax=Pseudoduganella chitinolytica TaxID=34070 RepID=A0ABY8BF57_9BURK|nr:Hpt domain-containing protein [Pseudoduganella chitinolytica]WEF34547.1 Hpt domain-containing protein [Pseudoduganella chitinolytica]